MNNRQIRSASRKRLLKELNKVRAQADLDPLEYSIKECLNCNKEFYSLGKLNRVCNDCKYNFKTEDRYRFANWMN